MTRKWGIIEKKFGDKRKILMKLNDFYIGESSEVLSQFPSESIDLTITSPPYDEIRDYKGFTFDYKSIIKQLFRVSKKGGVVVWVVGDQTICGSETGNSFRHALTFIDIGFNLHDTMIYEKSGIPFPGNVRYDQIFEYMFVFSKGKPKTINLIKDKKNKTAGNYGGGWNNPNVLQTERNKDGTFRERSLERKKNLIIKEHGVRTNIWKYKTGKGNSSRDDISFKHPASFPETLARDHILSWSNKDDLVLDPMCGSGTTCKMAWLNDRKFIGIDMSDYYINEVAKPRLKQYGWQGKLLEFFEKE